MTPSEMVMLFGLGMVFAIAFRLTRNILVLWPLHTPVGGLYTAIHDGFALPFEATYGFVMTIALMAALAIVAARIYATQKR